MKAVIVAAGEGSRLAPYTDILPKIMFPVGGKPLGRRIIDTLCNSGYTDILFCVSRQWSKYIQDYFGDGERFGARIAYSESDRTLGTAGEVKKAEGLIEDDFLVYYGDVLTQISLKEMELIHLKNVSEPKYMGVLGVQHGLDTEVGIIGIKSDGDVRVFQEKRQLPCYSWSAVAILKREVLNMITPEDNDFGSHIFPKIIKEGFNLKTYINTNSWNDVGNLRSYKKVNNIYENNKD